jgi:hypothetical protein
MVSTVYRQASAADTKRRAIDTDGALYSRYAVRRLDAESIRDRILAASGRLDRTQFGPPIPFEEDAYGQVSAAGDSGRRSVYLVQKRTKPISLLVAFDGPIMAVNCERRITSNSAPQALMLMNSEFILKQAAKFALQVQEEAKKLGPDLPRQQIAAAWKTAYLRPPTPDETEAALKFLIKQQDLQRGAVGADKAELAPLTSLCQQLLSSNEFLYVD